VQAKPAGLPLPERETITTEEAEKKLGFGLLSAVSAGKGPAFKKKIQDCFSGKRGGAAPTTFVRRRRGQREKGIPARGGALSRGKRKGALFLTKGEKRWAFLVRIFGSVSPTGEITILIPCKEKRT